MINNDIKIKITQNLRTWYRGNARDIPWRKTHDPYLIWVSEIMLQQTRVETVIPYYQRWQKQLPTLNSLAEADQDLVLNLWEGLGYYKRALNMHKTAQILLSQYEGKLPRDVKSLQNLPGIGRYSAGAISSIAYNLPAPIVDGNIRRIFTRIFNINTPIQSTETEKVLWQIALDILPDDNAREFNQALMELGALICLPKNPLCTQCPVKNTCRANDLNLQSELPVRKEKPPLPHLLVTAAIIKNNGKVLLAKRPPEGLLGGMWEYPGGKQEFNETPPETLSREIQEELNIKIQVGKLFGIYHHAYTHYKITLNAYYCHLESDNMHLNYHTEITWVPLSALDDFPMGKLDRLISRELQTEITADLLD
ncbi:MAG: A/G-specific adenine glycosylase [Anaerolineales bacterium]|nr:A/G-specific adenine glycosylase [Anaerolineales bacterium]